MRVGFTITVVEGEGAQVISQTTVVIDGNRKLIEAITAKIEEIPGVEIK